MNAALLRLVAKKHEKSNAPELRAGDVVRVHQKIREGGKERIQIFEGIVLRVRGGRSTDGTFTVRHVAGGIGIERTFPLHLPSITKVEKTRSIKLRQARPYFLRDLTARQLKRKTKGELEAFVTWEDTSAAEEEEKIKAAQAAEAEEREKQKAEEDAKAEAAVEAAKAAHAEADGKDEKKKEKADK